MMNQIVILGRLAYIGKEYITLVASKQNKEDDGTYGSFSFNVYCSPNLIGHVKEYNSLNDLIAVKGHLDGLYYTENNKTYRQIRVIADKLSFLSSSKASRGDELSATPSDDEEF
jgi:hypothetical protein